MKKTLILTLLSLFISQLNFAQTKGTGQIIPVSSSHTSNQALYINTGDVKMTDIDGSTYINDEFSLAKLSRVDSYVLLRYNAYIDEMELEGKDDVRYVLKVPELKVVFQSDNSTYQVFDYQDKTDLKKGFFRLLSEGEYISLLAKESIKLYEEKRPTRGYEKRTPATFKRLKDKLFISVKNSSATILPNKKKDILKIFSGKSNDIEKYAKKNKLGFKNNEDLTKIFNYFNSL
jgi:hypothetical protein